MELFYSTEINPPAIILKGEEAKHCTKSLRHNRGDTVLVGDGSGSIYECNIEEEKRSCLILGIKRKKIFSERKKPTLHIAISPLKNPGRLEWFVEKATELGVDSITFINCERTEKKNMNLNRIKNIIISAGKQSMQPWFPEINMPEDFKSFIAFTQPGIKLIAYAGPDDTLLSYMTNRVTQSVTVLIGPEGDFTDKELGAAVENGFVHVSLGAQRLRTETAGVFVSVFFSILKHKQ